MQPSPGHTGRTDTADAGRTVTGGPGRTVAAGAGRTGTLSADRTRAALDQSRKLLSSLAAGHDLDDLAAIVVAATGVGCKILTATGRPVCAVGRGLSPGDVTAVLRAARGTRHFPVAAAGRTVLPVGRARDRARAWHLVVDAPPAALPVESLDAFDEFASVAALVHARDTDAAALRDRQDDLAVAGLLSGSGGVRTGVVVVIACDDPARLRPLVRDALTSAAGDTTVAVCAGDVLAYVPALAARPLVTALQRQLRHVVDLLDTPPTIGYCPIGEGASFDGAVRGARQAARCGDAPLAVTSAASLGTAASLFSHVPDDVRRDFVTRVLGPVEEHDAATRSRLLETLSEFLTHDCSWVRTASAMHMHQNTVRYRIGRTEQLLGRNLSDMNDRLDVHLALALR